ncbi:hypothetical protein L1049_018184 [Liquidambar formosana]|uniref:Tetraspanin-19-like n=1 Tax=Liquidambar formosana TaxID=63359 RepID=A0AAP0R9P6_LIQFO
MTYCSRCCLQKAIRIFNLIVNLCGVGIIIYSLWLEKKWYAGVSELPSHSSLPQPWFISTCLGVGIAVCFSTLIGHMVANCITGSNLCIYIFSVCSLILLQVGVIVTILFRIDWASEISQYIDENHEEFESFVRFHLLMCRLITVMVVVLQVNVMGLAVILWCIGTDPRRHNHSLDPPDFAQSFLVASNMPLPDSMTEAAGIKCDDLDEVNPQESFLSYVKSVFRMQLLRRFTSR